MRANWKRNNVQVGLPDQVLTELRRLAIEIGKLMGDPRLRHAEIATWAVHHLLSLSLKEAVKVCQLGKDHEAKYGPKGNPGPESLFAGRDTVGRFMPRKIDGRTKGRSLSHDVSSEAD